MNLRLHPSEIARIANHARDRFVIVDDVLLPVWEQVAADFKPERVIVVSISGKPSHHAYDDYERLLASPQNPFTPIEAGEDDAVGLCYTSGTTGVPKGVLYSHRALALHSLAISLPDALGLRHSDVVLPLFRCSMRMPGVALRGRNARHQNGAAGTRLDPQSILGCSRAGHIRAGVPAIWMAMLRELDARTGAWTFLHAAVGGAPLPEAMIRGYEGHGMRLIHGWGMTETSPLGTIGGLKSAMLDLPDDERIAMLAKQGLPPPFIEIRTVNSDGVCPKDGHTMGELQIRGPWVAASYFQSDADVRTMTSGPSTAGSGPATWPPLIAKATCGSPTARRTSSNPAAVDRLSISKMPMSHRCTGSRSHCRTDAKWQERPRHCCSKGRGRRHPELLRAYGAVFEVVASRRICFRKGNSPHLNRKIP